MRPPGRGKEAGERRERLLAHVVLDTFRIRLGGVRIEADRKQEPHDQIMAAACSVGKRLALRRQEQTAIGLGVDEAVALEATHRRGDRRLRYAHSPGDLHGTRLAILAQQVRDQFDIVLGHRGPVGLTLTGETRGLVVSAGKASFAECGGQGRVPMVLLAHLAP